MPLTFDFPIEKLREYRGTNPRPSDFDEFWEAALAEIAAVEPEAEFRPAPFRASFADCSDLYFTGIGGARIHAKLLRPHDARQPSPAALLFHGYSANSGDWADKLALVAAGFTVAAMDCRGQGGSSEDVGGVLGNTLNGHIIRGLEEAPGKLLFRDIFLDTVQLARVVAELPGVDAERMATIGGSQGGGLALACAALEPRIKKAASTYPFLCDYRRVWEMDLAKDAYYELHSFFRLFDPLHEREDEIFTRLGYIDVQFLAPRIRADVLMGVGLMDTICPPSTQFAAYNKINSRKEMLVYPDFRHETLPGFADRVFTFVGDLL